MTPLEMFFYRLLRYLIAFFFGVRFVSHLLWRFITTASLSFLQVKERPHPPQCFNDPSLGNHAYIQVQDVKLHYVMNGDRAKPLMLFLHGFPECWYSWRHQLREFSSDYWVVAVDMRGYGDSDKPQGKVNYHVKKLVADIRDLVQALGKDSCTLVAHDWGGIIAWSLVTQEPQMVDSFVIMNSAHIVAFMKVLRRSWKQFLMSWYIYFFQFPYLPELIFCLDDLKLLTDIIRRSKSTATITHDDLEVYKYYFSKPGALRCPIDYYRANSMLVENELLQNQRAGDNFPQGLILFGDNDPYISPEVQEETVKLVKSVKLVYIPNGNHCIQQEVPEIVNQEMRKFFDQLKKKET